MQFLHSSSAYFHLKGQGKRTDPAADYAEGRRITIIGLVSNVALSIGYVITGLLAIGAENAAKRCSSGVRFTLQQDLIDLFRCRKALAGVVGNSSALVADAIHSLGDLVSDFVTLYTHRLSRSTAVDTKTYPYGLGKFEALGTFIVSLLLIASGIGIAWHSAADLLGPSAAPPHFLHPLV